jgi:hypothetical protein
METDVDTVVAKVAAAGAKRKLARDVSDAESSDGSVAKPAAVGGKGADDDDDDDDDDDAAFSKGEKKKAARAKGRSGVWMRLTSPSDGFEWISNTREHRTEFLTSRKVFCLVCQEWKKVAHVPNAGKHAKRPKHMKRAADKLTAKSRVGPDNPIVAGFARAAAASAASASAGAGAPRNEDIIVSDARAVAVLHAVSEGVSKNAVPAVYGKDATLLVRAAYEGGKPFTAGGVISRAYDRGAELLEGELEKWLATAGPLCLATDEATTSFLGRARPLAVLAYSSLKNQHVLLGMILDGDGKDKGAGDDDDDDEEEEEEEDDEDSSVEEVEEWEEEGGEADMKDFRSGFKRKFHKGTLKAGDNYPSGKAARAINGLLERLGIDKNTRIVGMSGDCASFEAALARKLGVPLILCVAHVGALAQAPLGKLFPAFVALTAGLSNVITSGGGMRRKQVLKAAGLSPTKLHCSPTRWGQMDDTAKYLLERENPDDKTTIRLETVRHVLRVEREVFRPAKEETVRVNGTKKSTTLVLKDICTALDVNVEGTKKRRCRAELETRIVLALSTNIMAIIKDSCSLPNNINVTNLLANYTKAREHLQALTVTDHNRSLLIVNDAIKLMAVANFDDKEKDALRAELQPKVEAAAGKMVTVLDKYKDAIFDHLMRRARYEPSEEPKAFVVPKSTKDDSDVVIAQYFGTLPDEPQADLMADWDAYVSLWPKLPSSVKGLGICDFWKNAAVVGGMSGKLPEIALWYACYPTSNVAIERAFSSMRSMEDDQRQSLSAENFQAELKAIVNSFLVRDLVAHHAEQVRTLKRR